MMIQAGPSVPIPKLAIGIATRVCELRVRSRRCVAGLVAAAVLLLSASMAVAQPSGTVLRQTMTTLAASTPSMEITIIAPKSATTTTKIFLEFGPDGNGATSPAPNPSLPASVNFRVTATFNPAVVNFSPAGGVDASSFPSKIVALSPGDPVNGPGLFVLSLTHQTDVTTTETWKVEIIGVPTSLRVMGSVDQGAFKTLTPVAVCQGGGQTCPSVCPRFQTCQSILVFPWWKYVAVLVDFRWPIPPDPCLSCPRPWDGPIREGFERVMVSVMPFVRPGEPLGAGRAREIDVRIRGGEPIGGLFDVGGGQYLQLIEHPRGAPPYVSVAAAGVTAAEMRVGPAPRAGERIYRLLTYVLGGLLLIALVVIGWLIGARARAVARG